MHLHEYQAKALFARYQIPVPPGQPVSLSADTGSAVDALGGDTWMVKAQIHAGGRGKTGGVKKVSGRENLEQAVNSFLGERLVTTQTGTEGQVIDHVLIEQPCVIARELYVACLLDRVQERLIIVASAAGGMDIEAIATQTPEQVLKVSINPLVGLQAYQCRQLAFDLDLNASQVSQFQQILMNVYRLYNDYDLSLLEINPLVVTAAGDLVALDAKIDVDDNALYRQNVMASLRDPRQEDPKEFTAHRFGLNYVALNGNIGCMVNGAGLAMATMDLIKLQGGAPANFLDVGGGTTADKVTSAFKLILTDQNVRAVLVNIFGGIVRCDLIAEGLIKAVREAGMSIPVVVRFEGTNVEQGRELLAKSGLKIFAAGGLTAAAQQVVALAAQNTKTIISST